MPPVLRPEEKLDKLTVDELQLMQHRLEVQIQDWQRQIRQYTRFFPKKKTPTQALLVSSALTLLEDVKNAISKKYDALSSL